MARFVRWTPAWVAAGEIGAYNSTSRETNDMTTTSAATAEAPPPATLTRWEYLTVPVVAAGFEDARGLEDYHAILNEYGGLGWELAGVTSFPGRAVGGWVVLLAFKRPAG